MAKDLYHALLNREAKLSLVGLGYVGMPIAVAFAKKLDVIGFDLNEAKIGLYQSGIDPTGEVGNEAIRDTTVDFTADPARLREALFHIVAVPTPVKSTTTTRRISPRWRALPACWDRTCKRAAWWCLNPPCTRA